MARYDDYYYGWRPYVSQAQRRAQSRRMAKSLGKAGRRLAPIEIDGRKIAATFWGSAWCDNLERYSDFENRLPRGRAYVRDGSVIDLQIQPGKVAALVSGSKIYEVAVKVASVSAARWKAMCRQCAGGIDSLVELLQGRFSMAVMQHLCREGTGLFPTPREIEFSCTCPDWALMCKHVAAVLYGVGARLDHQPELLFRLRQVDERALIAGAGSGVPLGKKGPAASKVLAGEDLGAVFGVDLAPAPLAPATPAGNSRRTPKGQAPRAKVLEAGAPATKTSTPGASRAKAATARPSGTVMHDREPLMADAASPVRPPRLNAAQRKAIAERMKRYWAERRKQTAAGRRTKRQ